MTIYFAWSAHAETFSPTLHNREDEDVFYFSLSHKEGMPATAQIHIKNPFNQEIYPPSGKNWIFLSTERHDGEIVCLFKGRLSATPVRLDVQTVCLEFTAQPEDWQQQLETWRSQAAVNPFWDPLFMDEHHKDDPFEGLKARCASFYWDRLTGKLDVSDFFQGTHTLNLEGDFYENSLKIKMDRPPVTAIEMAVEAQWIQHVRGYISLSKKIAQAFPEKMINTFTGKNFQSDWPRTGQRLGKSGYWVAFSSLEEIDPPATGAMSLYPAYSQPLWSRTEEQQPEPFYVKRFWFKGKLILGWEYRQKRREVLTFTLKNHLQPFFEKGPGLIEKHHIILENICPQTPLPFWAPNVFYPADFRIQQKEKIYRCIVNHRSTDIFIEDFWVFEKNLETALENPQRSSFFVTDRGVQAFEHALERAKKRLAETTRALHIFFSGPWDRLCGLTLDHSVLLEDRRLPGGRAEGKVIAIEIVASGATGERVVHVTLASSLGTGQAATLPAFNTQTLGIEEEYIDDGYVAPFQRVAQTRTGMGYIRYDDQIPEDKKASLGWLNPYYMIKRLDVQHLSQQQEEYLQQHQYPNDSIEKNILKNKKTEMNLELMKLRSKEEILHTIDVRILHPWSGPRHILFPK